MGNKNSIKPTVKTRITLKRVAIYSTILTVVFAVAWKFMISSAAIIYPSGVFGQYTPSNGVTISSFVWQSTISIDHTKVMDSTDLIDFPLLIDIEETELKSVANGGNVESAQGFDILFCGANDGKLDHQIESYDPTTGKLIAWVKLPILFHDIDTELKITCGNNSLNSDPSTESVWASEFIAVWHMNDNPSSSELQDAAGSFNGNSQGNMTSSDLVDGKISGAIDFDGTDDFFAIKNKSYTNSGQITELTVSAWVKTNYDNSSWTSNWSLIDFDRSEYFNFFVHGKGYISFCTKSNGIHDFHGGVQGQVNNDQWHHVVGVFDGQMKKLFIDGVLVNTATNPHGGQPLGSGVNRFGFIGEGSEAGSFNGSRNGKYYNGKIDELRLIEFAKSNGWIITEYNNQSDPSSFYSIGGANNLPVELVEFDAQLNDNIVQVSWATASERECDYFSVEKSTNGIDFETVGEVNGAGTTTSYNEYEFFDNEPYGGVSYYRLRQADTDGKFEIFNAVSVNNIRAADQFEITRVFPNPFTEKFQMEFHTDKSMDIAITLTDMNGRTVFTDIVYAYEGKNSYAYYQSGDLTKGLFFLNANANGEVIGSVKVIKK